MYVYVCIHDVLFSHKNEGNNPIYFVIQMSDNSRNSRYAIFNNNQLATVHDICVHHKLIDEDETKDVTLDVVTVEDYTPCTVVAVQGGVTIGSETVTWVNPCDAPLVLTNDACIYHVLEAVPKALAEETRQFLRSIPVQNPIQLFDDRYNPPLVSLRYEPEKASSSVTPNDWIVEGYTEAFYRFAPRNLQAYLGSPVRKLISHLECSIKGYYARKGVYALHKNTWVVQIMKAGSRVGLHNDKVDGRELAFIYYLTPESGENVGGHLTIYTGTRCYDIAPTFNTMVFWDMEDGASPLHEVQRVLHDMGGPRIALVGFMSKTRLIPY